MNIGRSPSNKPGKLDPYTSFKSDRERLWALMSRDVRLVICTLAIALWAGPQAAPTILLWLSRIVP